SQLTYDTSARLSTITDPVGITSSFTYSATEPTFVSTLTTPYGTTNYNDTPNPNDPPQSSYAARALTITDPMGYTEYNYAYPDLRIVPGKGPTGRVPSTCTGDNGLLQARNTYYWDKHAFTLGATISGGVVQSEDFSKSTILHWGHDIANPAMQG